jgi:hypothetical protein
VDFLRISPSILVPPLGVFLQIGLIVPAQNTKSSGLRFARTADLCHTRGVLRAGGELE